MAAKRSVFWSKEARDQVNAIKEYVREHWSEREAQAFLDLLQEFERLVAQFPRGYQVSAIYPGCRRAVIHANISVVYRTDRNTIEVVTVYDNRSDRSQKGV